MGRGLRGLYGIAVSDFALIPPPFFLSLFFSQNLLYLTIHLFKVLSLSLFFPDYYIEKRTPLPPFPLRTYILGIHSANGDGTNYVEKLQ